MDKLDELKALMDAAMSENPSDPKPFDITIDGQPLTIQPISEEMDDFMQKYPDPVEAAKAFLGRDPFEKRGPNFQPRRKVLYRSHRRPSNGGGVGLICCCTSGHEPNVSGLGVSIWDGW